MVAAYRIDSVFLKYFTIIVLYFLFSTPLYAQSIASFNGLTKEELLERSWHSFSTEEKKIIRWYLAANFPESPEGLFANAWLKNYDGVPGAQGIYTACMKQYPDFLYAFNNYEAATINEQIRVHKYILRKDPSYTGYDIIQTLYYQYRDEVKSVALADAFLDSMKVVTGKDVYIYDYIQALNEDKYNNDYEMAQTFLLSAIDKKGAKESSLLFDKTLDLVFNKLYNPATESAYNRLHRLLTVIEKLERICINADGTIDRLNVSKLHKSVGILLKKANYKIDAKKYFISSFDFYPTAEVVELIGNISEVADNTDTEGFYIEANSKLPDNQLILRLLSRFYKNTHNLNAESCTSTIDYLDKAIKFSYTTKDKIFNLGELIVIFEECSDFNFDVTYNKINEYLEVDTTLKKNFYRYLIANRLYAKDFKAAQILLNSYKIDAAPSSEYVYTTQSKIDQGEYFQNELIKNRSENPDWVKWIEQYGGKLTIEITSITSKNKQAFLDQIRSVVTKTDFLSSRFDIRLECKPTDKSAYVNEIRQYIAALPDLAQRITVTEARTLDLAYPQNMRLHITIASVNSHQDIIVNNDLDTEYMRFSPDGRYFATGVQPMKIWSTENELPVQIVKNKIGSWDERKFSPNGNLLAMTFKESDEEYTTSFAVYDFLTGRFYDFQNPGYYISDFAWNANGKELCFFTRGGHIFIYSLETRSILRSTHLGNFIAPGSIVWSQVDNCIYINERYFEGRIRKFSSLLVEIQDERLNNAMISYPHSLHKTNNGEYLVCSDNKGMFHAWNIKTMEYKSMYLQGLIAFGEYSINSHFYNNTIYFSQGNGQVENGVEYKHIVVLDLNEMKAVSVIRLNGKEHFRTASSFDGKTLYVGQFEPEGQIRKFDLPSGIEKAPIISKGSFVEKIYYEPANQKLAIFSSDQISIRSIENLQEEKSWAVEFEAVQPFTADRIQWLVLSFDKVASTTVIQLLNIKEKTLRTVLTLPYRVNIWEYKNGQLLVAGTKFYSGNEPIQEDGIIERFVTSTWSLYRSIKVPMVYNQLQYDGVYAQYFNVVVSDEKNSTIVFSTKWQDGWGHLYTTSRKVVILSANGERKIIYIGSDVSSIEFCTESVFCVNGKLYYDLDGKTTSAPEEKISNHISYSTYSFKTPNYKARLFSDGSLQLTDSIGQVLGDLYFLKSGQYLLKQAQTNNFGLLTPDNFPKDSIVYMVDNLKLFSLDQLFEKYYQPGLYSNIKNGAALKVVKTKTSLQAAPLIKIISPELNSNQSAGTVQITLQVNDQGGGIDEIRVYLNGKLIENTHRGSGAEDIELDIMTVTKSVNIQLAPGKNNIKAIALNKDRTESVPAQITVEYTAPAATTRLFILAIGINAYKNPKYALTYANPDAAAVTQELKKHSEGIFSDVIIKELYDADATKAHILSALDSIAKVAKPTDMFIFYYAGHGVMSEGNEETASEFYVVPTDVTQLHGNDELLKLKAISSSELQKAYMNIQAQKQLVVLDACQSGGGVSMLASRGVLEEKAIMQLSRSAGVVVLSATSSGQVASESKDLGHGIFTYAFLQALQTCAGSQAGKITVKELEVYVNETVPELTEKYNGAPQYPNSSSRGMDFPVGICK